jgi:hypothetical protein
LVEACRTGEEARIGDGRRPEKKTDDNNVRPEVIRFLTLGGDRTVPVHEHGLDLSGAWISGDLDMRDCECSVPVWLNNCRFDGEVKVRRAKLRVLSLRGSLIGALRADGLTTTADLFLDTLDSCSVFQALGPVELIGAHIGGDAYFDGGMFSNGKSIRSASGVSGNTGERGVPKAIDCEGATINGLLYFNKIKEIGGPVSFERTEVNAVSDDMSSWSKAEHIVLDGFRYGRIADGDPPDAASRVSDKGVTDAASRIEWLQMQHERHLKAKFRPQPWEQCVKVLREMGHDSDARKVAIAKQAALRAAGKLNGVRWPLHWLYGLLAGYGYKPLNTFCAMLLLWFIGSIFFYCADQRGWMGPSAPAIQARADLAAVCGLPQGNRLTTWTICSKLPNEYTTFNPLIYSLDLILPLVDLQQEKDWSPIVTVNGTEWALSRAIVRYFMWFEILFGWAMSLLLVAVLGNLVKKD